MAGKDDTDWKAVALLREMRVSKSPRLLQWWHLIDDVLSKVQPVGCRHCGGPANKICGGDCIQKQVDEQKHQKNEQDVFEDWIAKERPSGDVDQVKSQWEKSADLADFLESERDKVQPVSLQSAHDQVTIECLNDKVMHLMRENARLSAQPVPQSKADGCTFCEHPFYADTTCPACRRVTPRAVLETVLSDAEVIALWEPHYGDPKEDYTRFARAIEAATLAKVRQVPEAVLTDDELHEWSRESGASKYQIKQIEAAVLAKVRV